MEDLKKASKYITFKDNPLAVEELQCVLEAKNRVSPRWITELKEDEIFVFGSDIKGGHYGRAARQALEFGADNEKGEGPCGQSYAIPTTRPKTDDEQAKEKRPIGEVENSVKDFIKFAKENEDKKFLVTPIGVGYAGFTIDEIAPMFAEALKMENVYLPQAFIDELFDEEVLQNTPSDMIPSVCKSVVDYPVALERQLSKYCRWFRKNYSHQDKYLYHMDQIDKMCAAVTSAVDLTYRGLPAEAYRELKKALGDNSEEGKKEKAEKKEECEKNGKEFFDWNAPFLEEPVNERFYRMRVEKDSWVKKSVDLKGMFHIPYSLRGIVKSQRYSIPGFPCLYLAKHVYGCWEELGRPNLNDCLVSKFESRKVFKVLDMTIPEPASWKNGNEWKSLEEITNQVIMFPLIIACTFRTHDKNASFKPEYIVPQLVLQWVKEHGYNENKEDKKKNDDKIVYGVKYTSVNVPDFTGEGKEASIKDIFEHNMYDNFVLPNLSINGDYCGRLEELFKLSEPVCEEYGNIKVDSSEKTDADLKEYYDTRLGAMEWYLDKKVNLKILKEK